MGERSMWKWKPTRETWIDILGQIKIICTVIAIFLTAASMTSYRVDRPIGMGIYLYLAGTLGLWWLHGLYRERTVQNLKDLKELLWKHRAFLGVLLFAGITRLFLVPDIHRYDSREYFDAIVEAAKNFNFSLSYIREQFRLINHPTIGYTVAMTTGAYLSAGSSWGIYLILNVLTCGALYCLYRLFLNYWGRPSRERAAFYTLLIAIVPLFWGAYAYINPDYMIPVFFLYMVYEESRKRYLLMCFWLLFLAQTKEIAMVVVAGFFLAKTGYYLLCVKGSLGSRIRYALKQPPVWIAIAGAIATLFYLAMHPELLWGWGGIKSWQDLIGLGNSGEPLSSEKMEAYNTIAIIPEFIRHQIKLTFLLNFAWIFAIWMVLIILVNVIRRTKAKIRGQVIVPSRNADDWRDHFAGMFGSTVLVTLFLMVFITVPLNRYHYFTSVMIPAMTIVLYENTVRDRYRIPWKKDLIPGLVLVLLLTAQTFRSVDPVSLKTFTTVDTGKMNLMATGGTMEPFFDDTTVYNYQYSWQDEVLEKLLSEVSYDATTILLSNKMNIKFADPVWDPVEGRLQSLADHYYDDEVLIPVEYMTLERFEKSYIGKPESFFTGSAYDYPRAILLFSATDGVSEPEVLEELDAYYTIGERKVVEGARGDLVYYELIRDDRPQGMYLEEESGE